MPNCFQLVRKSNPGAGPVKFVQIDEEICEAVGEPVDDKRWCRGWYDVIGLRLATGESFSEIEQELKDSNYYTDLLPVVAFLRENYTSSAWAEIGARR